MGDQLTEEEKLELFEKFKLFCNPRKNLDEGDREPENPNPSIKLDTLSTVNT